MAEKLLLDKVKEGAKWNSIQLEDVESILSNDDFNSEKGLLTTTDDGVRRNSQTLMV